MMTSTFTKVMTDDDDKHIITSDKTPTPHPKNIRGGKR